MTADLLCPAGLHPRTGDGPCAACKRGTGERCSKGHDLTAEDATYTLGDGRRRCRECRRLRNRKARARKKRRQAEEIRGVVEEDPAVENTPTLAVPPRGFTSAVEVARYRHAVMVRKQRGLM